MIRIMNDLPDNVLGIDAEGKVTGEEYEKILIPAAEEKLKNHKKVRLLYQIGEGFTGFELSAIFDDAKTGIKHMAAWDKVAIVSDHHWINSFAKFFGHLFPAEVRTFKNTELEQAKKWISAV